MRASSLASSLALLAFSASPVLAAEAGAKVNLLDPHLGLMFWTLLIFIGTFLILRKLAFGPVLEGVRAREQALTDAMAAAQRDRADASRILAEQKASLDAARAEAQRFIAEGRATAESMRHEMLEQTRLQQAELFERARKEIEGEKVKAIAELRREAVDLAIAGAGRLIGQKLDADGDRKLVESYLATLGK